MSIRNYFLNSKVSKCESVLTMDFWGRPTVVAFQHLDVYIERVYTQAIQCSNLLYHLENYFKLFQINLIRQNIYKLVYLEYKVACKKNENSKIILLLEITFAKQYLQILVLASYLRDSAWGCSGHKSGKVDCWECQCCCDAFTRQYINIYIQNNVARNNRSNNSIQLEMTKLIIATNYKNKIKHKFSLFICSRKTL